MVHLRIVAPPDLTDQVMGVLHDSPAVCNMVVLPAAATRPDGDVLLCDVARETASIVLSDLQELGRTAVATLGAAAAGRGVRHPWRGVRAA